MTWRKALTAGERFLGSSFLSLCCFFVLAMKATKELGWNFDEYILLSVLYINFSVKIEQIHAAIADQSPEGRDAKRLDAKHASGGARSAIAMNPAQRMEP